MVLVPTTIATVQEAIADLLRLHEPFWGSACGCICPLPRSYSRGTASG
jgi:hypothetical protein